MADWAGISAGATVAACALRQRGTTLEHGHAPGGRDDDPRSGRRNWRVHARYNPLSGCFDDLVLTPEKVGKSVMRTAIRLGEMVITDRGYARVRDFQAALAAGGSFISRIGWRGIAAAHPGRPAVRSAGGTSTRRAADRTLGARARPCPAAALRDCADPRGEGGEAAPAGSGAAPRAAATRSSTRPAWRRVICWW